MQDIKILTDSVCDRFASPDGLIIAVKPVPAVIPRYIQVKDPTSAYGVDNILIHIQKFFRRCIFQKIKAFLRDVFLTPSGDVDKQNTGIYILFCVYLQISFQPVPCCNREPRQSDSPPGFEERSRLCRYLQSDRSRDKSHRDRL